MSWAWRPGGCESNLPRSIPSLSPIRRRTVNAGRGLFGTVSDLQGFYAYVTLINGLTGLVGKLSLGLTLAAVAMGNRRPGQKILVIVLAVHALSAAYVTSATAAEGLREPMANAAGPVTWLSLLLAVGFALLAWRGEEDWRTIHPTQPAITVAAWAAIAWAFWMPVYSQSMLGAVLWSPMAALPHSTLIVAGALAWMSARGGDQRRNWFVAGTCAGLALYDVALGRAWSSLALLVPAIGILVEQRLQAPEPAPRAVERAADGDNPALDLYEPPPPPTPSRASGPASAAPPPRPAAPPHKDAPPRKAWKLK